MKALLTMEVLKKNVSTPHGKTRKLLSPKMYQLNIPRLWEGHSQGCNEAHREADEMDDLILGRTKRRDLHSYWAITDTQDKVQVLDCQHADPRQQKATSMTWNSAVLADRGVVNSPQTRGESEVKDKQRLYWNKSECWIQIYWCRNQNKLYFRVSDKTEADKQLETDTLCIIKYRQTPFTCTLTNWNI